MNRRTTTLITLLAGIMLGLCASLVIPMGFLNSASLAADSGADINPSDDALEQADVLDLSLDAIEYIKNRDFESLAKLIHPDYNLIFAPYATINLATNKYFTAEEVRALGTDTMVYTWGTFDGGTHAIEMTVDDYLDAFVFDRDYTAAPMIAINTVIETGNALENVSEIFPSAQFVEFHFPSDAADAGYKWSTLRLVFEENNGAFALTAIVHSSWTA